VNPADAAPIDERNWSAGDIADCLERGETVPLSRRPYRPGGGASSAMRKPMVM
jgi:hypothetical protein